MAASFFDQFNVVRIIGGIITNSSIMMLILLAVVLIGSCSYKLIPTRLQSIQEIVYTHFLGLVKDSTANKGIQYFTLIITLFMFIAGLNLFGLFPYVFTPTAHIIVTFGLSFSILMAVTILGIIRFRWNFASMMMPSGAPLYLAPLLVIIETISYISRAISLGVRLAANLSAGHLLFAILASFGFAMISNGMLVLSLGPILVMVFITLLEIAVALIQAYVFCLLTAIYISDTLNLH
uniref:ATP synthase subunit a n=2 Tax=Plumarella TaxID=500558 RepID=A0A6C0NBM5_9CNID|nr:ATP synthase F0 subunit 6 [Plumarella spinosa]YP_009738164.1 ATP synthase F0 subunit 6 [Plumarella adhaerans]YP_010323087.1 ATP synthase F0 subunit 6 [Primnoella chilensis]QHW07025.1 ATP synthase F0 subunit 6 [Plumarella spinosa]QIB71470.1 ATP synthase F0 subunit 6 [Plumarella adhaerans]UKP88055.1 ATP synthase F0 subunit 6 [Primnoella chilensis]